MIRAAGTGCLIAALSACAGSAAAQIAELHMGAVGSVGAGSAYGPGAGLLVGLSAGRLTYAGVRWASYTGRTSTDGTVRVRTRTQTFSADVGVVLPLGGMELMPGISLGALRFAQRHGAAGDTTGALTSLTGHAVEFLVSPGLALEIHAGGSFAFIPEIQWSLAGHPDLPFRAFHRGLVATIRLVTVTEIGRVRR